jgi:hypothetical protein
MNKRLLAGLAVAFALIGASTASAQVHPGVQTYTNGGQCTANFIFTAGSDVFIGQAAHCSSTGSQTDTDGCVAESLPNGTAVEVTGASRPGTMVYNSWNAMQAAGETDRDTCAYNDFALVELDPADHGKVDPTVPTLGGPTALGATTALGDRVYSYGNSSLRQGITLLSPSSARASARRAAAGPTWSTR